MINNFHGVLDLSLVTLAPLLRGDLYVRSHNSYLTNRQYPASYGVDHYMGFSGGTKEDRHEMLKSLKAQETFNVRIYVRFAICSYTKYDHKFPSVFVRVEDAIALNGYEEQ